MSQLFYCPNTYKDSKDRIWKVGIRAHKNGVLSLYLELSYCADYKELEDNPAIVRVHASVLNLKTNSIVRAVSIHTGKHVGDLTYHKVSRGGWDRFAHIKELALFGGYDQNRDMVKFQVNIAIIS